MRTAAAAWGASVFALALTVGGIVGCAPDAERASGTQAENQALAEGETSDAALRTEIERKLNSDQETSAATITVTADDGVVTLVGQVAAEDQKERAADLAEEVDGVERVDNRLVVARAGAPAPGARPAPGANPNPLAGEE